MAKDGANNPAEGGVATLEREDVDDERTPETAVAPVDVSKIEQASKGRRAKGKNKKKDEEVEYEWELATPFGKVELEFEPTSVKERRDRKKKEDAEKAAAKAAAKAAKKAEKRAARRGADDVEEVARRGSMLVPVLIVIGLLVVAVAVAIWLFARPGAEDEVPPEFRNDEPEPEPEGFVAKARQRVTHAVRAGRRASRETQEEQQRKYEELMRGGSASA